MELVRLQALVHQTFADEKTIMEYALLSFSLIIIGLLLVFKGVFDWSQITRSESNFFRPTQIKILDVNLVHNNLTENLYGVLNEKSSIVLVRYEYLVNGKTYQSRRVFPLDVEWIKPRISPFSLFEDIKAGRISECYFDVQKPSVALLFPGRSPYLKKNVIGVCASGAVVALLGMGLFLIH